MHRQEVAGEMRDESQQDVKKKAPGSGLGLCPRIERGAALTAGRIPHPNSSSKTILISQKQGVAALEQFRGCSRAISLDNLPRSLRRCCARGKTAGAGFRQGDPGESGCSRERGFTFRGGLVLEGSVMRRSPVWLCLSLAN